MSLGPYYRKQIAELRAALDAIAADDALLDVNPEVFGMHAARRMQEQARAALATTKGEEADHD